MLFENISVYVPRNICVKSFKTLVYEMLFKRKRLHTLDYGRCTSDAGQRSITIAPLEPWLR